MRIFMSEKLVSSEIAEFTWNDHAEEFLMEHYSNIRGKWRFLVPILGAFAEKAERDTRERVAQEVSEIQPIPELIPADPDGGHTYKVGFSDALRAGAERIRGKE
jgi:hypothetical protein